MLISITKMACRDRDRVHSSLKTGTVVGMLYTVWNMWNWFAFQYWKPFSQHMARCNTTTFEHKNFFFFKTKHTVDQDYSKLC